MVYDVLVTQKNKRYTARVLLLPEIVATGSSESEVLEQVKTAISDLRSRSWVVRVEVSNPSLSTDDPWLRFAGHWADDPDWERFQTAVAAFRQEINDQTATL